MIIREAVARDLNAILAIEAGAFSDPWPRESFIEYIAGRHGRVTVAVAPDESVLGFAIVLRVVDQADLANLAVARGHRRQGIGLALLTEACAHAASRGVQTIFLEVRASNAAAQALYQREGFVATQRRRDYYNHPVEDGIVMAKALAPALEG
ncbi:MAG: ribosomal protein S18-alanine N-acetyltransferase [Gemmatimonadaceae bacterium]|nr:ribosomal protein S18-alanine N-acetyltransferase [Gemmatimonadaceae bacterium]